MSTLRYGVGMHVWKPYGIGLGMDLLVGGWSWLFESREASGGLKASPCVFAAGREYVESVAVPRASPGSVSLNRLVIIVIGRVSTWPDQMHE